MASRIVLGRQVLCHRLRSTRSNMLRGCQPSLRIVVQQRLTHVNPTGGNLTTLEPLVSLIVGPGQHAGDGAQTVLQSYLSKNSSPLMDKKNHAKIAHADVHAAPIIHKTYIDQFSQQLGDWMKLVIRFVVYGYKVRFLPISSHVSSQTIISRGLTYHVSLYAYPKTA